MLNHTDDTMNARLPFTPSPVCLAAALLVAVACQPARQSVEPAPPPPQSNFDPQVRANFVASHMDTLAAAAAALPGADERQFRSLMHDVLGEMIRIAVLSSCRDKLAALTDESNSDAVTTTALLTATRILHGIAERQPVDDPALFRAVLDCDEVNRNLDDYQGALHRVAVGVSARKVVVAMRQAAADYAKTLAPSQR
jgi:hypothetical protein